MPEGENEAFKKSGMGGKEEDRILLLQGQDFWGMEEGGRSRTQSFTQEHTSNMQGLWSSVRVHIIEVAKSRQALEPTAEHEPQLQCWLHSYRIPLPED